MKFYIRDASTDKYYGLCFRKNVPEIGSLVTASQFSGQKFIVKRIREKSSVITEIYVDSQETI